MTEVEVLSTDLSLKMREKTLVLDILNVFLFS